MMKTLCILQARFRSTRLPGKVMKKVDGVPLLEYEIRRLKMAENIDKIVLATGTDKANDPIARLAGKLEIECFRGSEDDVLDRFYQCAKKYPEYPNVIRVTGDCPLIDPMVIDEVAENFGGSDVDYLSNVDPPTFPDGMDVEIMKKTALEAAARQARLNSEREHVTLYIRSQKKFGKNNLRAPKDYSAYRLTVDNPEDFEVVSFLIENTPGDANYLDYVQLLDRHPEIRAKNQTVIRNEGLRKSLNEDQSL